MADMEKFYDDLIIVHLYVPNDKRVPNYVGQHALWIA